MNQVTEEHVFDTFNTQMRASLTAALKWGDGKLYTSDVQNLDQVYLSGFAKAADRQYHNCNACKSFLRRYGGRSMNMDDATAYQFDATIAGVQNVYAQASATTRAMRSWGL